MRRIRGSTVITRLLDVDRTTALQSAYHFRVLIVVERALDFKTGSLGFEPDMATTFRAEQLLEFLGSHDKPLDAG